MTLERYSVSICTFAVDETESLRICIRTILKNCQREDLKEIIICTCSRTTAACRETIRQMQEEHPDVAIRAMEQPPESLHWGAACRVMFDAATGTHILSMSSDLECNPSYVGALIDQSKQNPAALVKASRWMDGAGFTDYGFHRKLGNRAFQLYMRLLFGPGLTDYTYSFQIAPAGVFRDTYFHRNGRTVAIELIAGPVMRGIPVMEIPVPWKKRTDGQKRKSLRRDAVHLFWYCLTALDIRFRLKR